MKVSNDKSRRWGLVVGSGLAGLLVLAIVGSLIEASVPVAQAGAVPNEGWVQGGQSGELIGLDSEAHAMEGFPLKHTEYFHAVRGQYSAGRADYGDHQLRGNAVI